MGSSVVRVRTGRLEALGSAPSRGPLPAWLRWLGLGVSIVLVALIAAPPPADAKTRTFKPVKRAKHSLSFAPRAHSPRSVAAAKLRLRSRKGRQRTKKVSVARVRRAVRKGSRLRVKRPRRDHGRLRIELRAKSGSGNGSSAPARTRCHLGSFTGLNQPGECWRPYADDSPFNRPVPSNPKLLSNSGAIVDRLVGWGKAQDLLAGHSESGSDWWHPIYYSQSDDPLFTVKCTRWTSSCEVEGERLHIPEKAKPASAGDGHMAVIDQSTGVEYDFWQVRSKPIGGGVLEVSHGGMTRIDGDGLGSNATAAHFGLAAGIIRGEEMLAGEISHALFSQIKCSSGSSVYPAAEGTSAAPCSNFGLSNKNAPPLGSRLWLAMSDSQIGALPVPAWKKTILRAMADYGVIIGDTMNGNGAWGIQAESGASYTSFGLKDPWDTVGERADAPTYNGGFVFDIDSGVDWARYLRVLDPCISLGSC